MPMFSVKFLGADYDYTDADYPLLASLVASINGLISLSLNCYELNNEPNFEGSEKRHPNGYVTSDNKWRGIYRIRLEKKDFPSADCTLFEQYPELTILKKDYVWIYSTDYPIGFKTSGATVPVSIKSSSVEELTRGMKIVSLELGDRNAL